VILNKEANRTISRSPLKLFIIIIVMSHLLDLFSVSLLDKVGCD